MNILQYNDSEDMSSNIAYEFRLVIGDMVYKNFGYMGNMGRITTYKSWINTSFYIG